jgi:hypothetical protein
MNFHNSFHFRLCAAATAGLLAITLSGCGVDYSARPSSVAVSGLNGIAHGGPNPITGATVTLYATSSGGSFASTAPFAYTPAAPTVHGIGLDHITQQSPRLSVDRNGNTDMASTFARSTRSATSIVDKRMRDFACSS